MKFYSSSEVSAAAAAVFQIVFGYQYTVHKS